MLCDSLQTTVIEQCVCAGEKTKELGGGGRGAHVFLALSCMLPRIHKITTKPMLWLMLCREGQHQSQVYKMHTLEHVCQCCQMWLRTEIQSLVQIYFKFVDCKSVKRFVIIWGGKHAFTSLRKKGKLVMCIDMLFFFFTLLLSLSPFFIGSPIIFVNSSHPALRLSYQQSKKQTRLFIGKLLSEGDCCKVIRWCSVMPVLIQACRTPLM